METIDVSSPGPRDGSPAALLRCRECGAPARVRVLEGYAAGVPVCRDLCIPCADRPAAAPPPRPRPATRTLLVAAGVPLAALGVAADQLGVHGTRGFGAYQTAGVLAGGVCVLLGGLLKAEVLSAVGLVVFSVAAVADLLGLAGTSGFGWKQQLAVAGGLVLVLAGSGRRGAQRAPGGR